MLQVTLNNDNRPHGVILRLKKEERKIFPHDVELSVGDCTELSEQEISSFYYFLKYTHLNIKKISTLVNPDEDNIWTCIIFNNAIETNEVN